VNYPGDGTHPAVVATRDFDGDGSFLYGGQIGCNWQQPGSRFVVGVEGDIAGLSGGGFGGEVFRFGAPVATDHFNATGHFANEGSLRLRGGYAVDRMLFYVAGGWTRARLNATAFYYRDGDGSLTFDNSVSRDGWNIGFGGEYSLGNNWTMGLEYRFTDYGSITRNVPAGTSGTLSWSPFVVSVDNMHTSDVRLRLNYKFNRGFGTAPVITPFL
jgi:outer membrane immunogenic protein